MKWLHRVLLKLGCYRRIVARSKKVVVRGFQPLTVYHLFAAIANEINDRILITRAAALAFNFMLAFFPATIFIFTLIPYIHINHFQDNLLNLIATILPNNTYAAFQATLEDLVKHRNGKLLSLGFLSTMYFATNGLSNLMAAFNKSQFIIEKRSWMLRRIIATWLTILMSVMLLTAITILTVSTNLIHYLKSQIISESHFWIYLIISLRWVIVMAIFFASISLLYRYAPANKEKWNFLNPGTIVATLLAVSTSMGFAYYINHFASYNKIYGSIGTLIILMLWLNLNSFILLIGFDINAHIDYTKRTTKKPPKPKQNKFKTLK